MSKKRDKILWAATQLFAENGFEKTSITDIVKHANTSKGLVYHYFESKDDLLREIVKNATDKMLNMNEPPSEEISYSDLHRVIRNVLDSVVEQNDYFRFNLSLTFQPHLRNVLNDLIKERSSHLFNSVQNIFEGLNVEDPELSAYIFISEIDGIVLDYLSVFENYPIEKMKQYLLNKYKAKNELKKNIIKY